MNINSNSDNITNKYEDYNKNTNNSTGESASTSQAFYATWLANVKEQFPSLEMSDKVAKLMMNLAEIIGLDKTSHEISVGRSFIRAMQAQKAFAGHQVEVTLDKLYLTAEPEAIKKGYTGLLTYATLINTPISASKSLLLNLGLKALDIGNSTAVTYIKSGLQFVGTKILKTPVTLLLRPISKVAQLRIALKKWTSLNKDSNSNEVNSALAGLLKSAIDASREGIKILAVLSSIASSEKPKASDEDQQLVTIDMLTNIMAILSAGIGIWQICKKSGDKKVQSKPTVSAEIVKIAPEKENRAVEKASNSDKSNKSARSRKKTKKIADDHIIKDAA